MAFIVFFTNLVHNRTMAKQDDYVRYTIRVPRDVYAEIEKRAADAERSINAEILEVLKTALFAGKEQFDMFDEDTVPIQHRAQVRAMAKYFVQIANDPHFADEFSRAVRVKTPNHLEFDYGDDTDEEPSN